MNIFSPFSVKQASVELKMKYYGVLAIAWVVAVCGFSNSEAAAPVCQYGGGGAPYENCKVLERPCTKPTACGTSLPATSSANTSLTDREASAYENLMIAWNTSTTLPSVSSVCMVNTSYIGCSCNLDASNNSICNIISIWIENRDLGMVPEVLSQFTSLQSLILSNTKLYGAIPDFLGDLTSLQNLILKYNRLNGSIPKSFEKLRSLTHLDVTKNMLSGPIPPFLGALSNLTYLKMSNNLFTGNLPAELGKLKGLQYIALWCNRLTGHIPSEYAQLTSLSGFSVAGNNMSGPISSFLKTWTNLTILELLGNNFEGTLPPEVFKSSYLETLTVSDLKNSSFQFPQSANLTSIRTLIMRNCSISGVIPPYIGDTPSLITLDLSFNNISGGIPDSLNNLSKLKKISLARNKLNGSFPSWATKKDGLMMDISYNNLQVTENFVLQKDQDMSLFDCCSPSSTIEELNMISLSKSMESQCPDAESKKNFLFINCGGDEIYAPVKYHPDNENSSFYISSEEKWAYTCSGELVGTYSSDYIKKAECEVSGLYEAARYCPVSLTYYGFCLENGNYTVQLFFSEIAYLEEENDSFSRDRVFDVYIQDELRLKDFNIKEKAGGPCKPWNETFTVPITNSSLKIQLYWAGKGTYYMNGPLLAAIKAAAKGSAFENANAHNRKLSMLQIILIAFASLLFLLLVSLCFIWKLCWSGKRRQLHGKLIKLQGRTVSVKMLIDATGNFSRNMEIGKGSYGTAYRATLGDQTVAVKKLSPTAVEGFNQFTSELYTLKRLKHENVVKLLDGHHGDGLHLLIYEFVENNSLQKVLFEDSSIQLNWEVRYNVILGVARGLKYLHKDALLKMVHRDIKPSNILLDGNLKAKISDFGLARLYNNNENQISEVAGTNGYIAPEYATRGEISYKVDIYSLGILILEIVSGMPHAGQKENEENVFLHELAYRYQNDGRLIDLVDQKLAQYDEEQAIRVLSLAMMCADQSPGVRPDICDVLSVLEGDKTIQHASSFDFAPTPHASGDTYASNTPASGNATTIRYVII